MAVHKGDAENTGGFHGIPLIALIEISNTEEEHGVGMLGLQVVILAHHGTLLRLMCLTFNIPHMLLELYRLVPCAEINIVATLSMQADIHAFLLQFDNNLCRGFCLMVVNPDTCEGMAVFLSFGLVEHKVDVIIRSGAVNFTDSVRLPVTIDLHVRGDAAPLVCGHVIMQLAVLFLAEGFLLYPRCSLLLQVFVDDHEAALVAEMLIAVAML